MKLGVNTVLFKAFPVKEAMEAIRLAGYDGVELSAIAGMCEHLVLDDDSGWQAIKDDAAEIGVELLSMEVASLDEARLEKAFKAARFLGIPVVNVGPGGKMDDAESLLESIETLRQRAELAAKYGVTLCCKAHVGCSIHDTPTTLAAMEAIGLPSFGVDMDPSHIYRAGEHPENALPQVVSRVRHIHIRDCKGNGPSPGVPMMQACGRGDIDLFGYFKALVDVNYQGPVCLEVIGPDQTKQEAQAIASESFGYMNAILKKLGNR